MKHLLLLCLLTASAFAADAPLLQDDFSAPQLDQRRAMRGEWTFADHTATLKLGDFTQTYDHPSFARPKTNFSLGFSFGTLSVKEVAAVK
jgi:hypothetical protein